MAHHDDGIKAMNIETLQKLSTEIDDVFFIIGAIILLIEIAEAWFKGSLKSKNFLEMLASASTQIPYIIVEIFIMTSAYGAYYILAENVIPWELPLTWWVAVLAIIAADFTYYWEHRIAHQVRILWTQHAVHHSSREFNIITGVRFGPLEGVWSMVAYIPMIAVGFPPDLVFFGILSVLAYQTWIHTETIGKLGPIEWVLNTPSHHRVHHGSDRKYLDKNYGGISIIWDRVFGSFQIEEEKPNYGLMRDFDSQNPINVWFSEIPALWQDLKNAKNGREMFMRLFARPGWRPK